MAINWPTSPSVGDTYVYLGQTFRWDGEKWVPAGLARFVVSETAPSNPVSGDGWFNLIDGRALLYVDDGSSQAWVDVSGGGFGASGIETLAADRTYYVATTGNDLNDGRDAARPFLTIQRAINAVHALDLNGHNVVIQVADGAYNSTVYFYGPFIGIATNNRNTVTLRGNVTTPANCTITTTGRAIHCINAFGVKVEGFKLATNSSGSGFTLVDHGFVELGRMDYGACAWGAIEVGSGGIIDVTANQTIAGNSLYNFYIYESGELKLESGITVTFSGTPAFTVGAACVYDGGVLNVGINTVMSGAATGKRFDLKGWGSIQLHSNDANYNNLLYFPGNEAGVNRNSVYCDYAPRRKLTGNLTIYVRTDGTDATADGGADTAARAFATIGAAYNFARTKLDLNGYTLTINVAAGTYSSATSIICAGLIPGVQNYANVQIAASGSVTLRATADNITVLYMDSGAEAEISGFNIESTAATKGRGIYAFKAKIKISNCGFGTLSRAISTSYAVVSVGGALTIYGNAQIHCDSYFSAVDYYPSSVTASGGTRNHSSAFMQAQELGFVESTSVVFSGTFTGKRYNAVDNALIETYGSAATYFPGDAAGTVTEGGIYT